MKIIRAIEMINKFESYINDLIRETDYSHP